MDLFSSLSAAADEVKGRVGSFLGIQPDVGFLKHTETGLYLGLDGPPARNTKVVLLKTTQPEVFALQDSKLMHVASGLFVRPMHGESGKGVDLVLSANSDSFTHEDRTILHTVSGLVMQAAGCDFFNGCRMVLDSRGADEDHFHFDFEETEDIPLVGSLEEAPEPARATGRKPMTAAEREWEADLNEARAASAAKAAQGGVAGAKAGTLSAWAQAEKTKQDLMLRGAALESLKERSDQVEREAGLFHSATKALKEKHKSIFS